MLGAMMHTTALAVLTPEVEAAIAAEVNQRLNADFTPSDLLNGTPEKKRAISDTIKRHTASALRSRSTEISAGWALAVAVTPAGRSCFSIATY